MKYDVYSIRDKYTGFMSPMLDQSDDAAKRNFAYAVNNNPGVMNYSPADFDLYKVGSFDTKSGDIKGCVIEFICNGMEVFNEKS